jgi:hypothetical protein
MLNIPDKVLAELAGRQNILLLGAGGSFDILACMPLYYTLVKQFEVNIHLANYSFVHFLELPQLCRTKQFEASIQGATSQILSETNHFPEGMVAKFFKEGFGQDITVWMIENKQSIPQLHQAYSRLIKHLHIDAIIACGFGLRSIMQGNEQHCGDMLHTTVNLGAISKFDDIPSVLMTIGHEAHGPKPVSLNAALENITNIVRQEGYMGGLMLEKSMQSYEFLKSLAVWLFQDTQHDKLELIEAIIGAVEGGMGPFKQGTYATPLMAHSHFFDIKSVMLNNQILPTLELAEDYGNLVQQGMGLIQGNKQRATQQLTI